jgi:hypothetical protein
MQNPQNGSPRKQSEIAQRALALTQVTQPLDINGGLVPFDEGCKMVKRSPYTVRGWLRQGKLTRYKRGRETFLDPAEFVPQPQPKPVRAEKSEPPGAPTTA